MGAPLAPAAHAEPAARAAWPAATAGAAVQGPSATRTVASPPSGDVVLVVLADIAPAAWPWGWSRIVRGAAAIGAPPGLRMAKVMGSGQGGGFGLRPSPSHQGLFLAFADLASARRFCDEAPQMALYRERTRELCTALLQPLSCRGSWGGRTLAVAPTGDAVHVGPVAALTRASIRLSKAPAFWRHAPAAQRALAAAPGCRLAAGLGEAPLLRQATFSVWDGVDAMARYARGPAHGDAVRAAYAGGHFGESMFARFRVLELRGRWQGATHG